MRPFCVIGTPRSRTAWFAEFLSHGAVRCFHEPSKHWSVDADIAAFFQNDTGASDSMLTLKWRELLAAGVNLIAVERPVADVMQSATGAGMPSLDLATAILARICAAIGDLPDDVPRYGFDDLDASCGEIFARCHGYEPTSAWLDYWRGKKIEASLDDVAREASANIDGLMRFYNLEGY